MATIVISLFGVSVLIGCIFLVSGWQAAYARKCLVQAADLVQQREFDAARQLVLIAVKQNPALKSNLDVQAFYEIIVAKSAGDSLEEFRRIVAAIPQLPKTKGEKVVGNTQMQVVLLLVVVIFVLLKLVAQF